jgi:chromosome partitioning protein
MRTIALLNWKGGSAKTTTALSLAVGLAQRLPKRQRVLLVDSDPQANATMIMLEGSIPGAPTLTDVLQDDAHAVDAIRPTRVGGLDILPADRRLRHPSLLADVDMGKERRLRLALKSVEDSYSICVVDSPPHSNILTTNVIQAVTEIIVPIDPGLFAIAGLGELQETVERARKYLDHPDLAIAGLLITRFTKRKAATELEDELREVYGDLVFRAVIPTALSVEDAHASYRTILEWDPTSTVAKKYYELVMEVLGNGRANKAARGRGSKPRDAA